MPSPLARLAQLKRKWPFDPRPNRTVSANKDERCGTVRQVVGNEAMAADVSKAEANAVLPAAAGSAHGAAAAAAASSSAASAGAAAVSVSEDATDSTDTLQRPWKRIKKKPTGVHWSAGILVDMLCSGMSMPSITEMSMHCDLTKMLRSQTESERNWDCRPGRCRSRQAHGPASTCAPRLTTPIPSWERGCVWTAQGSRASGCGCDIRVH